MTEDGHYATFCYPRFGRRTWANLSVLRVEFTFPYFIDKVGVTAEEEAVTALTVYSPTLASILGINPVEHSFDIPNTGGSAKFNITRSKWETSDYTIEISDKRNIGTSSDRSEARFISDVCLVIRYNSPRSTSDALQNLRALDDFLGVVSGCYVSIKAAWLEVLVDQGGGESHEEFQLSGYDTGFSKSTFVHRHETLAELSLDENWAEILDKFFKEWSLNEISFKWFRSSQIKQRYVEEIFFYTVRLIERYFRSKPIIDDEAEKALSIISHRSNGDDFLIGFVDRRLYPMLARAPSLTATLRTLYTRFPEIKAFSEIKPQRVAYLRGKEAHGADTNYNTDEYVDMDYLARSFLLAFRISILERCGFDRQSILDGARAKASKVRGLLQ